MNGVNEVIKPKKWLGTRHVQVILIFLGMIQAQCTRTIMSVTIVDMTDPANEHHFDWSLQKRSIILSSFTWGYVVLQLFTGVLDRKFGGKNLMILTVGISSMFSLILPLAATHGGWIMFCVIRGIQGVTQSIIIGIMTSLIAKWIPMGERGRTTSFVLSGCYLGIAFQFTSSGYIAYYWGWPMIFYVHGIAAIIWTLLYLYFGSDNPQVSKSISIEERLHIQSSLGQIGGHQKLKTPWKSIFTSLPFYATLIANVGFSWGYWLLLTQIPTYMNKVLKVEIQSNGVLSSLPYVVWFLMNFPVGFTSDCMIKKKWVKVSTSRKIFNSIGFFGVALSLYGLTFVPAGNVTLAVLTLCIALGLKAGYYNGFIVAFIDMSPNFTSTLVAIGNFTANFLGLFAPLFVGFIVKDENDPKEWHIVFYVTSMVYIVTNIIYIVFASSEVQSWNGGAELSETKIKT